ncbi:hypothetical protein H4Q26_005672 [Puccinia striiformis f. sp. tritici PST-130]|nr:hypothetical protein H4Q26_005672 [Puccinia striiformis f. sp. tritici PST-130]
MWIEPLPGPYQEFTSVAVFPCPNALLLHRSIPILVGHGGIGVRSHKTRTRHVSNGSNGFLHRRKQNSKTDSVDTFVPFNLPKDSKCSGR